MVQEADKYRGEDEKQRDRVSAKNALESYCLNIKQTMEDDKVCFLCPRGHSAKQMKNDSV
jgi:molecular chaperone DnaK (HSP70)